MRAEDFLSVGAQVQAHRGPDGAGATKFEFDGVHVALGHQRLAILDLSDAGAQPMVSASGRFVIAFNGEVYNHVELARKFELSGLRSGTDTEVVLELIEKIGIERALPEFNGMWAFVLLDRERRLLHVSRDRFGKKPLYWMEMDGQLFFSSEAKVLVKEIGPSFRTDALVAARYLVQSLQDVDDGFWVEGIRNFPAASWATVDLAASRLSMGEPFRFWSLDARGHVEEFESFVENLRATVEDAVLQRLRTDVPVGVALSGGLDSSIIAQLVAGRSNNVGDQVRFLSAVSPGQKEDESEFIDIVAAHLGVAVEKVELDAELKGSFTDLLKTVTFHNDAPLASFSNVLFYLLMQRARQLGLKVIYSGQGADEAFCGYKKYPMFELRRLLRAGSLAKAIGFAAPFAFNGTVFQQFNLAEAKRYRGSAMPSILGESARAAYIAEPLGTFTSLARRQIDDLTKYSVPYLTHYEDRLSMAASCEVRAPFLDYRVVEMGVHAPVGYKLNRGWTKYCLRKAFADTLPSGITWRKDKQGFVNPQDAWLRGRLSDEVDAMIADPASPVFSEGLVDQQAYRALFDRYRSGDRGIWFREVFAPYALDTWLRLYRSWA